MLKHRLHPPYDLTVPMGFDWPCRYIRCCRSTEMPERGVDMHFIYYGQRAAVQFVMATNWHVWEPGERCRWPIPLGLAIHTAGEDTHRCPITHRCHLQDLGKGEFLIRKLVKDGDEAVWAELERVYHQHVG